MKVQQYILTMENPYHVHLTTSDPSNCTTCDMMFLTTGSETELDNNPSFNKVCLTKFLAFKLN